MGFHPPSIFRHPIQRFKDRIRFVYGRRSDVNYIRLWPNPGFMVTVGPWQVKWSKHRGLMMKRSK